MSRARNLADLLDSNGDVVSGALDNVPPADVVNDTTPQLGGDLASNGNDITFGDNDKAIFGAGSDLQIYHDGSHSYIHDAGTGQLRLKADTVAIVDSTGTEYLGLFNSNGASNLYYDESVKLATQSTGVSITGIAETSEGIYWGELYNQTGLTTETFVVAVGGSKLLWVTFGTTNSTADLIIYGGRLYSGQWHCHGWKIPHNSAPTTFSDSTTVSDSSNTYSLTVNGGINQMVFSRSSGSTNWSIKVKYAGNM